MSSLDGGKSVKKSNSMMTIDLERMVCVERKRKCVHFFACFSLWESFTQSLALALACTVYSITNTSYSIGKIR